MKWMSLLFVIAIPLNAQEPAGELLMRQTSGTGANPMAASMRMDMAQRGSWMLMLHGVAFLNAVEQSGPQGRDKLFSTNWLMAAAQRPLGGGQLMFRSMLSLEPLTASPSYPELFQTGETLHHRPLVDAQHPHDLFMELAVEYAHPVGDATAFVYAAPVGDPALGPVAFSHRASAAEIPQATLGHHLQDSTHIAGSVITAGAKRGMFGFAASGFHGREPDENRWDVDTGKLDSWSARLTFEPVPNWSAQVSTGHLVHPEASEPGNVQRTTASVSFSGNNVDASLIFGRNDKRERSTDSVLAEGVYRFGGNAVTGRAEIVDKDELAVAGVYRIKALTLGYTRDVAPHVGLGFNVTGYAMPSALESHYGSSPHSAYAFVRLR